jgi:cation:H+ antiporter
MTTYILFIFGFLLLIKGADWLVDGSTVIAKKLNVSNLVIGLTVVAFGTSTPELFVNLFASFKNSPEIALGNILGSNIFNVLVILGISAVIFPLAVTLNTVWKEIPLTFFATILLPALAYNFFVTQINQPVLTRIDGATMLTFFVAFLLYIRYLVKTPAQRTFTNPPAEPKSWTIKKTLIVTSVAFAALSIGAKWVVNGAVKLAIYLNVSQSLIALTIVAAGTSLPELATSAVAAWKKNTDIAVGNVIGSNIFNILLILGISCTIRPIPFQGPSNIDVFVAAASCLIMFVFMFSGRKHRIDRWEGLLFLAFYTAYIIFLITTPHATQ